MTQAAKLKLIIKDRRIWRVYPDGSMKRVYKGRNQHFSSANGRKEMQRHKGYEV